MAMLLGLGVGVHSCKYSTWKAEMGRLSQI